MGDMGGIGPVGFPLWNATTIAHSWLHGCRGPYAGAWYRSEHRRLHAGLRHHAQAASGVSSRATLSRWRGRILLLRVGWVAGIMGNIRLPVLQAPTRYR